MEKVECRLKIFTGLFNSRGQKRKLKKKNVFQSVQLNMLNSVLVQVEIHQKLHKLYGRFSAIVSFVFLYYVLNVFGNVCTMVPWVL